MTKRSDHAPAQADTLRAYLRELASLPRLSPDDERDLATRIQTGDDEALRRLVEANLRFVVSYAKRFRGLGVPFLDLIHEGNLGLLEAARRFDPDRHVKFITYGVWWIRQCILHTLSDQSRIVSLPTKLSGPAARLGEHLASLKTQLEREPTTQELAQDLDISEADATALLQIRGNEVSLSDRVDGRDGDAGRELGDDLAQQIEPPVEDAMVHRAELDQLRLAVDDLHPKERAVMRLRFGLDDGEPCTLQQIGKRLQLTRERIRQIESRAKERLRRSRRLRGMRTNLDS